MARAINEVAVFGLGKVGELVASMLAGSGFVVSGFDAVPTAIAEVETRVVDVTDAAAVRRALADVHAAVSCLPYSLNIGIARQRRRRGPTTSTSPRTSRRPAGSSSSRPSTPRRCSRRSAASPRV